MGTSAAGARLRAWRRHGLALAGLALLTLLFFWPVTFGLGYIPHAGGDLVSLLWPNYGYAARALWAGRLPLWNPALFAGAPFALDNQVSFFYPVNLLTFLAWPGLPYPAMEWLAVFHVWLAGAGMYLLLIALLEPPAAPWPALLAAVAYMFSDVFVTHVGNLNLNAVAAWLPWAFAGLHLALARRSAGWAAGAGVAVGLAVLAGHAQMTYIAGMALGAYVVWEIAAAWRSEGLRAAGHVVWLAALVVVIAGGLGAVTLLPTLEMTAYTARVKLDYASAASYAIPWPGLAGLFSPLVFGRGAQAFWGPWERVELGYLGVLPLFFAGLAPFRGRRGLPVFLAWLAAGALLVALGPQTPVHRLLYDLAPGFAGMRVPARFILLTDFALAVLAGLGLQRCADVAQRRRLGWGALLAGLAAAALTAGFQAARAAGGLPRSDAQVATSLAVTLALLGLGVLAVSVGRRLAPALAVFILAVDLITQGAGVEVDAQDPTQFGFRRTPAVEYVLAQPAPARVDAASGLALSAPALFGLEAIGGVHHALALAGYQTYLGAMGPRGSRLYDFLNAQWIIAEKGRPPAGDPSIVPVFNDDPQLDVYLNTEAQPRLTLVHQARTVADGAAAFGALMAPDFDPRQTVVVETGVDGQESWPAAPEAANLYYLAYAPEAYRVAVTTPAPAYMVFSEVWYPGWRAWVDGRPAPVWRANFAFRAVKLAEPGEHVVEMRFEPLSQYVGLAIMGLTVAGLAGYGLWRRRRPA